MFTWYFVSIFQWTTNYGIFVSGSQWEITKILPGQKNTVFFSNTLIFYRFSIFVRRSCDSAKLILSNMESSDNVDNVRNETKQDISFHFNTQANMKLFTELSEVCLNSIKLRCLGNKANLNILQYSLHAECCNFIIIWFCVLHF